MCQWLCSWLCSCAQEQFDCDSRLIAAFRHAIVLLSHLFMKFRLFGDFETISTICKGIMNVFLFPPLLWLVCAGEKVQCNEAVGLSWNFSLFHPYKVYKGKFYVQNLTMLRTNEQIYRQIKSANSNLFLPFKMIPFKNVFILHISLRRSKQGDNWGRKAILTDAHNASILTAHRKENLICKIR